MDPLRNLIRKWIPKQRRHDAIEAFNRWEYWYQQGRGILNSFKITTMAEIMAILAFVKYVVIGWDVRLTLVTLALGAGALLWLAFRTWFLWRLGKFWHDNNGYKLKDKWNLGKVPPGRMEIINIDELAEAIAKRMQGGSER